MTHIPLSRLVATGRPPGSVVGWSGGRPVDFARFAAVARQVAGRVAGAPGRRVALACRDSVWFAAGLLGLLHGGARVVVPGSVRAGALAELAGRVDLLVSDEPLEVGLPVVRVHPEGRPEGRLPPIDPEAAWIEFYTSGSTGAPKGVARPLACLERECETLDRMWGAGLAGAPALATVPHQHVYGMTFKVLWPLSAGRPFAGETHELWEELLGELPSGAVVVTSPAHLTRLTGLAPVGRSRRPRLVLSAGAPLPVAAARDAAAVLGVPPTEIFGSTETGAIAWRRHVTEDPPWRSLPGVALSAEDGCLVVHSPFVPGGRHAGADLVELTPDGGFRLRGRADRVVKIEGKRVSLPEVEARLARSALVEAAAATVLGGGRTARLAAAVVLSREGRARLAGLGAFRLGRLLRRELGGTLESAALPSRWRYVDALPSGALGKRRDADVQALFRAGPGPTGTEPEVLAVETAEGGVSLSLRVSATLEAFRGHFPGVPILPGVVQVDWAMRLAGRHLGVAQRAARDFRVKFRRIVRPGVPLRLTLRLEGDGRRLTFEYRGGDDEVVSTGQVAIDP